MPIHLKSYLHKVAPLITRCDTVMRQAIPPGERLALTLRFIATGIIEFVATVTTVVIYLYTTGETYESLKFLYRISVVLRDEIKVRLHKSHRSVA